MPPIRAFALATTIINFVNEGVRINERIIKGASFCQVDKIRHEVQDTDVITDGYHKWHGTIPNFRIIDITRMMIKKSLGIDM